LAIGGIYVEINEGIPKKDAGVTVAHCLGKRGVGEGVTYKILDELILKTDIILQRSAFERGFTNGYARTAKGGYYLNTNCYCVN
jgi:hypothetical protein